MFASGEYPDVIIGPTVGNNGPIDIEAYGVSEHILLPLNELIDEYMPIYKERLSKSDGWKSLISSDGKMYTLGNLSSVGYTVNGQYFINKKWLDKLSIPVPTTVTELTDVFRAFKTSDPNENGELDEIPWVATFDNVHSGVYTAFSFWGIPENGKYITINDEDKIEFTPYMQGYRECLEWLSQIYQEGLLDIESITQSENVFLAKLNEDKAGFFAYFRLAAMNIDPTVETHELMMPVAAEGYSPKLSKTLELAGPSVFVTVSNQYVPETMRWLDTMLEPRNCVESMFGPEGELWTYNDSGVAKLLGSDQESVKYALNVNTFYYLPAGMFSEILEMPQFVMDKADFCTQYDESGFLEKNSFQLLTNVIKPTVDESAQLDLYRTDIEKFIKESITDFIQNGVTDQSWSNFQATLQDLNVEEYLKIYQDVYDRFISN
jgi:putative aldouronate transport system substrate-binding protein